MKKVVICFLAVMLIFSYNSIEGYDNYEEIETLEYLLNQRICIMNGFLYGPKEASDVENLNLKLSDIEADALLNNDLDILYKVIDNPTDYELALSVNVDKINSLQKYEEELCINVDLNWHMRGYEGEFSMVKNYDIKCVESEDKMYLTSLKYIHKDYNE